MIEVNFLSKYNRALTAQQEKDKKILRYVGISFVLVLVIFFIIFSISLYYQYQLKQVKTQTEKVRGKIDSEKTLEADYYFFVNKLVIIRELFDQRADKQIALGYFANLFGPHVTITGLEYNMDESLLQLKVISPHVFYLEEVINALEKPEVIKQFASLSKTNLTRIPTGEYSFSLIASFSEDSELVTVESEY